MHRWLTDTENLQDTAKTKRKHRLAVWTSAIAHESDIFVVVISVQEAMNIAKIYISTKVNACAK